MVLKSLHHENKHIFQNVKQQIKSENFDIEKESNYEINKEKPSKGFKEEKGKKYQK